MAAVTEDHQISVNIIGHSKQLVTDMAVACHHTRLTRILTEPFGYLCLHKVIDLADRLVILSRCHRCEPQRAGMGSHMDDHEPGVLGTSQRGCEIERVQRLR